MSFFLNQTEPYHKHDMDDLRWEVTVCNSMEPQSSPVRQVLAQNRTYGEHLAVYLFDMVPPKSCHRVMEVGGGYGFLMRDLLTHFTGLQATMVDISEAMISRQRQTLQRFHARFLHADFFKIDSDLIREQDLVIMNEIAGDFPTACQITRNGLSDGSHANQYLEKIREYMARGIIQLPLTEPVNVNIGAMAAIERLCSCHVPCIFLSEHSCEAAVNDQMARYIKLTPTGNPEEIRLIGHSEYTIKFSHLESIARSLGYTVVRGNYTDFITVNFSNRIHRIFKSNSQKDEFEIIRHFIEDLYTYEYLFLLREP